MGFQPAPGPEHSGDTGATSEGCRSPPQQPIPRTGCPSSFLAHSTGAGESRSLSLGVPWWPCLHVPQDTACPTGQTHWQQLSKAGLSLSWHSCPAPRNSSARQRGRANLPPLPAQAGFAACVAAALVLRRWRHLCTATAVAVRNGTRRHEGGELWGAKPPDPSHGSTQEAESQQAVSGEYLQVRQKLVLMSTLFGGLSHHSATFFLD